MDGNVLFADVALFLVRKEPFELVMPNPAPFSSPPLRLYARAAGVQIGDDWLAQLGGTGVVEHGASILTIQGCQQYCQAPR